MFLFFSLKTLVFCIVLRRDPCDLLRFHLILQPLFEFTVQPLYTQLRLLITER